jgi:hypothetical protein
MTTTLQQLTAAQANKEAAVNRNFETLSALGVYGKKQSTSTGLTWGYYGGRWGGFSVADGTFTLTNASDNYIVAKRSDGVTSASTATTNWNNTTDYARCYKVTTAGSVVTAIEDHRTGLYGVHGSAVSPAAVGVAVDTIWDAKGDLAAGTGADAASKLTVGANDTMLMAASGQATGMKWATPTEVATAIQGTGSSSSAAGFRGLPVNSQSGNYTTVLSDVGKSVRHPSGAGAGDTFTIDSQANVTWPDGAALTFENRDSNALSIAITTDTLRWAQDGSSGTRTLAQYGIATAIFDDAINEWLISGTGLT